MGQALAGGGKEVPGIGGHIECAIAACLNDAERGGIVSTAFIGAGSEADPAGDDAMAQGALGIVVGRWQRWIVDEHDDRIPVVEDLAREGTHLVGDLVLMALTVPLQTSDQPLDGCVTIAGSDLLDEAAQITRGIAAEGGAGMVVALGERHRLRMRCARPRCRRGWSR
jgi:hypothetical protein